MAGETFSEVERMGQRRVGAHLLEYQAALGGLRMATEREEERRLSLRKELNRAIGTILPLQGKTFTAYQKTGEAKPDASPPKSERRARISLPEEDQTLPSGFYLLVDVDRYMPIGNVLLTLPEDDTMVWQVGFEHLESASLEEIEAVRQAAVEAQTQSPVA